MCGRYVTISKIKEVEKRFGVTAGSPGQYRINTNVSAGQSSPVITDAAPDQLDFFTFGFTPFWAKKRMYVLNARSEGDHNKDDDPAFIGAKGIISSPCLESPYDRSDAWSLPMLSSKAPRWKN